MFIKILFLSLLSVAFCDAVTPWWCMEVLSTATYFSGYENEKANQTLSGTASATMIKNETHVSVYNIKGHDYINDLEASHVCSSSYKDMCSSDLMTPFNFSTTDNYISVYDLFNNPHESEGSIDFGPFDENSISGHNGEMYSKENPCSSKVYQEPMYFQNFTSCCKTFIPAPIAPKKPRCLQFTLSSQVLNSTDNYKILISSNWVLNLKGNIITTTGNFTYYSEKYMGYDLAYFSWSGRCDSDTNFNCTIVLPKGDSKTMFSSYYQEYASPRYSQDFVGRILIRDEQTLMSEGIPFTKEDDCMFNNDGFNGVVINSKFCCSAFEN